MEYDPLQFAKELFSSYVNDETDLKSAERLVHFITDDKRLTEEIVQIAFKMDVAVGLSEELSESEMQKIEADIKDDIISALK